MRASRLVQLLLLLQARGKMTAGMLARELEVSERTVHRDVDALSAAGVPIYAERGPHGGIQLVDGYRTRLTGLTAEEAEALFLSGLPGPAAELGLGTVVAAARLKVLAALPAELRARASRLVERFHLDASGWFHDADRVPHLAPLADAVWEGRRVEVRYRRDGGEVERTIDPLGIVLKAGVWYLVAGVDGSIRTYRVARISAVRVTDQPAARPSDFELSAHWAASTEAYERETPRITVTLRIAPDATGLLSDLVGTRAVGAAEVIETDDPDGWHHVRLAVDWPDEAPGRLLAAGDRIEVLDPPAVRERMRELAESALRRYARAPAPHR
ncbi:MAG: YafY family transcriptional regulator [Chloroflexi bacterium]|nr:YafY family transcriptional regulator [Chloroflexota bacterium]